MGRTARVVLVSRNGQLLGMLPKVQLECPFWPESADVVAAVRAQFDARVVVLRLLDSDPSRRAGGEVTYLAELDGEADDLELSPVHAVWAERSQRGDLKRMPWAELGGPARSRAWASAALGVENASSIQFVQQRTWNLSSLWRLEVSAPSARTLWLKEVPLFMKHEASVLRWLNRAALGAAPALLAADDNGRSLLEHVAGKDLYGASVSERHLILSRLHDIQLIAANAVDELLEGGVPDLRGAKRGADCARKLKAWATDYSGLEALLGAFDAALARLEESGLPATLVHSDNHPGNARAAGERVTLLDWGEAFIGHPVTDILGLTEGLPPEAAAPLLDHWCASWKQSLPRSKPELALEVGPFVAAMHGAATYAHFLSRIEQTEWPYHLRDVPRCLDAAAAALALRSIH